MTKECHSERRMRRNLILKNRFLNRLKKAHFKMTSTNKITEFLVHCIHKHRTIYDGK